MLSHSIFCMVSIKGIIKTTWECTGPAGSGHIEHAISFNLEIPENTGDRRKSPQTLVRAHKSFGGAFVCTPHHAT